MEHQTVKEIIKKYLEGKGFVFGGIIEDYLRETIGTKGESTSRICRMMVKDGTLEPMYVPRKGGRSNVAYRLRLQTSSRVHIPILDPKMIVRLPPLPKNPEQGKLLNIPAHL